MLSIGELAQMVERSLSMREVPGSIPGFSKLCFSKTFLLLMLCVRENLYFTPTAVCLPVIFAFSIPSLFPIYNFVPRAPNPSPNTRTKSIIFTFLHFLLAFLLFSGKRHIACQNPLHPPHPQTPPTPDPHPRTPPHPRHPPPACFTLKISSWNIDWRIICVPYINYLVKMFLKSHFKRSINSFRLSVFLSITYRRLHGCLIRSSLILH